MIRIGISGSFSPSLRVLGAVRHALARLPTQALVVTSNADNGVPLYVRRECNGSIPLSVISTPQNAPGFRELRELLLAQQSDRLVVIWEPPTKPLCHALWLPLGKEVEFYEMSALRQATL